MPMVQELKEKIIKLREQGNIEEASRLCAERQKLLGKPYLSISMLVSNRIGTIRQCMESIKPLMEAIPMELIIVDTVGEEQTDGSLFVAREYATKVIHFDWCSDFSAARNTGLFACTGEWFMVMDDDECLDDISEVAEFFRTGEYLSYASATYNFRNYVDVERKKYTQLPHLRFVRLDKDTKFVGTIHEHFSAVYTPCKEFVSYAHHYGYVYQNEEERLAHSKRNMTLLEKELEKDPSNFRYRTQMALELANIDNEGALRFCEETFQKFSEQVKSPNFQWQLSLVFCLYEALGVNAAKAREKYLELKERFGYSETAENAICFSLVRIHTICGEYAQAYPYAVKYFQLLEYLRKNARERERQSAVDFYRYQNREGYLEMLHFGAYSAWQAGEYGTAWQWYMDMPWEDAGFENEEAFDLLLGMANENLNKQALVDIVKRIMKNTTLMQRESVRNKLAMTLQVLKNM